MSERMRTLTQYGIESTRGTAVAATRVLGCDVTPVPPDREWDFVKYADGRRSNANLGRADTYLVQDTLRFTNGYFQLWPIAFLCGLDGTISQAEQTPSQTDYLWTATPLLGAANDPDSITLEEADNTQGYEIEYVQFNRYKYDFTIPQDMGPSPVAVELGYYGRQVTKSTVTPALSLPTGIQPMNGKLSRLYLDTTWAGKGTTEISNALRGAEVEVLIGNHPKQLGSANRYFATHGEGEIMVRVTLTLERGSGSNSIYDLYQAGTQRALRLDLNGPQIGSGTNHRKRLDVFGQFQMVTPIDSEDRGNNIDKAVFVSVIDSSANFMEESVVTNMATA